MTADMAADSPLAEWAYLSPAHPTGVRASELSRAPDADLKEVIRFWFLANYQPLGPGPWFGFDGNGYGFGQAPFAPSYWNANTIIADEFSYVARADVCASVAAEFHAKTVAWCLIPDVVTPTVLDLSQTNTADLPAITLELMRRLERLEQLQQVNDKARHEIGGNQGPPLMDFSTPIENAKQAILDGGPAISSKAAPALESFKASLSELRKGALQEVGKYLVGTAVAGAPLIAHWLFQEVSHVIPLLEQWISLVTPMI